MSRRKLEPPKSPDRYLSTNTRDSVRLWRVIGFGALPECRDTENVEEALETYWKVYRVSTTVALARDEVPVWDGDNGAFTVLVELSQSIDGLHWLRQPDIDGVEVWHAEADNGRFAVSFAPRSGRAFASVARRHSSGCQTWATLDTGYVDGRREALSFGTNAARRWT